MAITGNIRPVVDKLKNVFFPQTVTQAVIHTDSRSVAQIVESVEDRLDASEADITSQGSSISEIMSKQSCEFLYTSQTAPWTSSGILSGTSAGPSGTPKHPGIVQYGSSTSANSGYVVRTSNSSILLGGGEKTTFIFKPSQTLIGITRRMGFHNTLDVSEPVNGAYAEIIDGILTGKTSSNSVRSATGSTYTLTADTWYRLKIELNSDATLVTYTLYADDSDIALWKDTVSSNIPTATSSRTVGQGDVCTYSGTTAIAIGSLDYIDIILPNARKVE